MLQLCLARFKRLSDKQIIDFYRDALGIKTNENEIYLRAVTHKSYNNSTNNERLEFLGDAVLDLIVSQQLFVKNKDANEGFLSIEKSKYVSRENLNKVAERIFTFLVHQVWVLYIIDGSYILLVM